MQNYFCMESIEKDSFIVPFWHILFKRINCDYYEREKYRVAIRNSAYL